MSETRTINVDQVMLDLVARVVDPWPWDTTDQIEGSVEDLDEAMREDLHAAMLHARAKAGTIMRALGVGRLITDHRDMGTLPSGSVVVRHAAPAVPWTKVGDTWYTADKVVYTTLQKDLPPCTVVYSPPSVEEGGAV